MPWGPRLPYLHLLGLGTAWPRMERPGVGGGRERGLPAGRSGGDRALTGAERPPWQDHRVGSEVGPPAQKSLTGRSSHRHIPIHTQPHSPTHTDTHTHAHIYRHTQTHAHTCTYMHIHRDTETPSQTRPDTQTHTHTHSPCQPCLPLGPCLLPWKPDPEGIPFWMGAADGCPLESDISGTATAPARAPTSLSGQCAGPGQGQLGPWFPALGTVECQTGQKLCVTLSTRLLSLSYRQSPRHEKPQGVNDPPLSPRPSAGGRVP